MQEKADRLSSLIIQIYKKSQIEAKKTSTSKTPQIAPRASQEQCRRRVLRTIIEQPQTASHHHRKSQRCHEMKRKREELLRQRRASLHWFLVNVSTLYFIFLTDFQLIINENVSCHWRRLGLRLMKAPGKSTSLSKQE